MCITPDLRAGGYDLERLAQMTIFALIDHQSHNVLGEFSSREDAEDLRAMLVNQDSRGAKGLEIHEDVDAEDPPETAGFVVAVHVLADGLA
jgi:hypothetical protein